MVGASSPETGEIYAIYIHSDGYPEGVGATLLKHYSSDRKMAELIKQGDASILDATIPKSVFYHRDRGEPVTRHRYQNRKRLLEELDGQIEYVYLWEDHDWIFASQGDPKFRFLRASDVKKKKRAGRGLRSRTA